MKSCTRGILAFCLRERFVCSEYSSHDFDATNQLRKILTGVFNWCGLRFTPCELSEHNGTNRVVSKTPQADTSAIAGVNVGIFPAQQIQSRIPA